LNRALSLVNYWIPGAWLSENILYGVYSAFDTLFPSLLFTLDITDRSLDTRLIIIRVDSVHLLPISRGDGVLVPLGPGMDTGVHNPHGYTLNYNGKDQVIIVEPLLMVTPDERPHCLQQPLYLVPTALPCSLIVHPPPPSLRYNVT
jgi:hypothetical protein